MPLEDLNAIYYNTQIRKEEVDLSKHRATKFADYPPRCFITAYPETAVEKSATPELRVQGLHKELTFPVIMGETTHT